MSITVSKLTLCFCFYPLSNYSSRRNKEDFFFNVNLSTCLPFESFGGFPITHGEKFQLLKMSRKILHNYLYFLLLPPFDYHIQLGSANVNVLTHVVSSS